MLAVAGDNSPAFDIISCICSIGEINLISSLAAVVLANSSGEFLCFLINSNILFSSKCRTNSFSFFNKSESENSVA